MLALEKSEVVSWNVKAINQSKTVYQLSSVLKPQLRT